MKYHDGTSRGVFDAPLDATYVWLGLGAVAVALVALAAGVPAAPPPDPNGLAGTIDRIAASPPPATAARATTATQWRVTPDAVVTHGSRARLAFGPVVPVADGRLARIARGAPPPTVFAGRTAFTRAVTAAAPTGWQSGSTVYVAHVSWGTDVTLVTVG